MGLPTENESYVTYFLTFKFIWAPIINIFSFVLDWFHEAYMSDAEQMSKSFKKQKFQNDEFGNTELTSFLAGSVYNGNYDADQQKISTIIKELVALAESDVNARELLITPNNPSTAERALDPKVGFPLNTPLMLMVKAGDIECVNLLLPFYSREDLMTSTLGGNSVFHIASITGQREILVALIHRAQELNMSDVLIENKNKRDNSPKQLLDALFSKDNCWKNFLDFCDHYLGAEEINKAACRRYDYDAKVYNYKNLFGKPQYMQLFKTITDTISNTSSPHETSPSTLRI